MRRFCAGLVLGMLLCMAGGCANGEVIDNTKAESTATESTATESKEAEGKAEEGKPEEGSSEAFADRPNEDTGLGEIKILEVGDIAPDFTAQLADGTEFKLSDHDDGVVILNFFATWCGPCVKEMPAFGMLQENYEDLTILCVDCMETQKTVDSFISQNGYTFPIAYDEEGKIESYYPTDGIPYTLVISKGVIKNIYIGARDALTQYNAYRTAVEKCYSEE